MRVLIVDDHPMIIAGCRGMLANQPDIDVIEAYNAQQALDVHASQKPDVIIVDINLPGLSGFELLRRILHADASARVIIFTMNDDPAFAARSIESGAKGYLTKTDDPGLFLKAIRLVADGGTFVSEGVAQRLVFFNPRYRSNPIDALTGREVEVVRMLADGMSVTEIAHAMGLSYKTAANSVSLLKHKLGAKSRSDLIRIAVENKAPKFETSSGA